MSEPKQCEPGWKCPECGMHRGEDQVDPCLGRLPGVIFACCGHGSLTKKDGYIYFENGKVLRFSHVTQTYEHSPVEILEAKQLKRRMGQ